MTPALTLGSYELLQYFASLTQSYLGIGVQEGHCVEALVRAAPTDLPLTLCDTWGFEHGGTGRGSHDHVEARLQAAGHVGTRRYLDGPSQQLIPALGVADEFDLVYVDGSHEEAAAFDDLVNCWHRTRRWLLLHDVKMAPVMAACYRWLDSPYAGEIDRITLHTGGFGTAVVWRKEDEA